MRGRVDGCAGPVFDLIWNKRYKEDWLILVTRWWRSCTWETYYYGTR